MDLPRTHPSSHRPTNKQYLIPFLFFRYGDSEMLKHSGKTIAAHSVSFPHLLPESLNVPLSFYLYLMAEGDGSNPPPTALGGGTSPYISVTYNCKDSVTFHM